MGIEPTTSSLARRRSTAELRPQHVERAAEVTRVTCMGRLGAEGQNRTDDTSIFSAVLYQLSYLGSTIMVVVPKKRVKAKNAVGSGDQVSGYGGLRSLTPETRPRYPAPDT